MRCIRIGSSDLGQLLGSRLGAAVPGFAQKRDGAACSEMEASWERTVVREIPDPGEYRAARLALLVGLPLFSLDQRLDLGAQPVERGIGVMPLIGERRRVELPQLCPHLGQFEQARPRRNQQTDRELNGCYILHQIEIDE